MVISICSPVLRSTVMNDSQGQFLADSTSLNQFFKRMLRIFLATVILHAFPFGACGESIRCGFIAGARLTNPFISPPQTFHDQSTLTRYDVYSKRFTIGPKCELPLPRFVSIEADALYKRLHYSQFSVDPVATVTYNTQGRWVNNINARSAVTTDMPRNLYCGSRITAE